ncbi:MAG TPA: efflux RND transporter periplasmic adaptor subunit [Burkholderiales bacterium]|nr:efflux RND transporter periplasmic adaptor subunit [Burkholderiales bacterium]
MSMLRTIVLATAVAALGACSKHEPPPPAPRAVIAQVVGAKPNEGANVYSGEVRARHENDLAFRVGGKVVARYVDVGATVKKGTELARLDPQDAQLGVESARSQLAAAEADHALAKAELARYRDLYAKQYVSKAVLDARENTFNTTKARLEQARAQAQVARNQSSYTSLVAEADGVITAVNVEAGQVVSAGQPVLRFARPEEKEVAINVPETRLRDLRDGNQVTVALWAAPDKPYIGRVREVAPNADPATRTFMAKITILDPDIAVKLGMTANVLLGDSAGAEVITLPLTALTQVDGKPAVWVVDPQTSKVNLRPVAVGAYREDGVTVRDGLRAGEVVVTAGVHKLLPGETVRVMSETLASPRSQQALDAALRPGS